MSLLIHPHPVYAVFLRKYTGVDAAIATPVAPHRQIDDEVKDLIKRPCIAIPSAVIVECKKRFAIDAEYDSFGRPIDGIQVGSRGGGPQVCRATLLCSKHVIVGACVDGSVDDIGITAHVFHDVDFAAVRPAAE